ncbi:MAG: hypothetical protein JWP15_2446 [Alphaproteobacteria bacterium]|nr:hypothetical protein [Alphaproteobacteria bacterium]
MVAAMMAPALAAPLSHLWLGSPARYRWRAISLFGLGYFAVWLLALSVMFAAAALLVAAAGSVRPAGVTIAALGIAWQASPLRSACLARCHLRPQLSSFGAAALGDSLRFGAVQACWCVTTCWALMTLPMLWPGEHGPLSAAATLFIAIERAGGPRRFGKTLIARVETDPS